LARLDSGKIQDGTQFPIEHTPNGFKGRRKTYLKGLNIEHIALIERYQPYSGCNWTGIIRDLSNPDKHRELIIAQPSHQFCITNDHAETIIGGGKSMMVAGDSSQIPMNMNNNLSFDISFGDGRNTIHTLKQLKTDVATMLSLFYFEFK
jgi:hypothetical protein